MHPKALLDSAAELLKLVLRFEHPADAVVSRFIRDQRLGPRERATVAETTYAVLRKKTLFNYLAQHGSGPLERRLAILGFAADRDFLFSALSSPEKEWLQRCDQVLQLLDIVLEQRLAAQHHARRAGSESSTQVVLSRRELRTSMQQNTQCQA
jgi:hypothetical protein